MRVSVVVPSHDRRVRLRWLLNALEEQALPPEDFEVVVVHTYPEDEAADLARGWPYPLRLIGVTAAEAGPARQRNRGWRAAAAPLVAFTDDDCRPEPGWLAALVDRAAEAPGAIVQGLTTADLLDSAAFAGPHWRVVAELDPPGPWVQTANVLYPRAALERLGGFDEAFPGPAGEDSDLALRAQEAGVPLVGAPGAVVLHAVEDRTILGALRLAGKWRAVPLLVARHPGIRDAFTLRVFWRRTHLELALALAGAASRRSGGLVLTLPYLVRNSRRRQPTPRGQAAALVELPGQLAVHVAEVVALVRGSIEHRAVVL